MREILFRGKTILGEWVYGLLGCNYFRPNEKYYHIHNCETDDIQHEVIPKTIGQFTGLTDKNGKKIFEGDIVAYNTLYIDGKEIQEIGYFECNEHFVSFRIHGTQITPFYCEVIGNIHDNPELLEKSNENQTK